MIQLLNNIDVINLVYFLATIIENYLFISMLLLVFDVKSTWKQKVLYLSIIIPINMLDSNFISSPFNVFINYACVLILIIKIFKLNILKSFTSLIITTFVFGLLNTLIQKPYLSICQISLDTFTNTPKYRIPYLIILYFCMHFIIVFLKNFRKIKIKLDLLDSLDKQTTSILFSNLLLGILILIVQLVLTDFYIDIVPLVINLLNFILLIAFLILSIYSFTRIIKLATTEKRLTTAEEYNKSLKILYDTVNGFKHDFNSILSSINGYIDENDMDGLKLYFTDVKQDFEIANNLSLLNPNIINNPAIYSLLNNEYFKATQLKLNFEIEFFLDINSLDINIYIFSRILGILIDNAIEAAEKSKDKIIKLSFIKENVYNRSVITIENTYSDKNININKIFKKGISTKDNHSGIGLWEIKNYIKKNNNLGLNTTITNDYFKQELFIYNL